MEGNGMSKTTINEAIVNCVYVNDTGKTAILKIDLMGQWLERVVEAGKEFLFKAPEGAYLEIFTYEMATMVMADRVPCRELAIQGGIFFLLSPCHSR
jgi:hypothetical protein